MFGSTRNREVHFGRSLELLVASGILAVVLTTGSVSQEVTSPQTLDELFVKLGQLQDANLGIARQMSETQRRAAAVVQTVLDEGAVSSPAHREIGNAFISNALTLASIVLAPVATQQVAAGDAFMSLLRRNLVMIENAQPLLAENAELAAAMKQYAVLQMQTQDLAVALQNGWSRYGETLTTAQVAGMLRPGSFDPAGKSWSLQLPPRVAEPVATSGLSFESGADAADVYGDIGLQQAAPTAVQPQRSEPAPTPPTTTQPVTSPQSAAVAPQPEAEASAVGASPGLAVETPNGPPGSRWTVIDDAGGHLAAVAPNADAATATRIASVQIGCHPNGTLRYLFEATDEFPEYWVYANETDYASVRAEANTISGGQALKMSDTLRFAFEWATRDPAATGWLVVSPADEAEVRAKFPVEGYLEARGRVLDACQPWEEEEAAGAEGAPATGESPAAVEPGRQVAPIPYPRPKDRLG